MFRRLQVTEYYQNVIDRVLSVAEEEAGKKKVRSLSILPVTLKTYIKWKTVFRFGCATESSVEL